MMDGRKKKKPPQGAGTQASALSEWPTVTLRFVSCERGHYLKATLESARECINYPHLEWIVVDDDSVEPGLREYIRGCDWIQRKEFRRQTHAAAMNQLVEMASGEFILIWPEDVQFITRGDWLQDLVELLQANPDIGGVCLDAQRRCTLNAIFHPAPWERLARFRAEIRRFGWGGRRRPQKIVGRRGFTLWTCGGYGDGIVGSGIPSLMRTSLWRELGPWRAMKPNAEIRDSSLGAEDDMMNRVREKGMCLQLAIPQVPVAADIINDDMGCKAKVRKGIRYGNYTPPPRGGTYYYAIRSYEDRKKIAREDRPLSFSECVEPLGFEIFKDRHGDRLKTSFNSSPQVEVRSQEQRSPTP